MFLYSLTLPNMTMKPFINLQTHNYLPAMFLEEDLVQRKMLNNPLTVPRKEFYITLPSPLFIDHPLNLLKEIVRLRKFKLWLTHPFLVLISQDM